MKKASGKVYMLKWYEPFIPRDSRFCTKCSQLLTLKDFKSKWFYMHEEGDNEPITQFRSLYTAARKTGISISALRNAFKKTNEGITRIKFGPVRYEIGWSGSCSKCIPFPR